MIEQLRGFPDDVLAFTYSGHITRAEFERVLLPVVHAALQKAKGIRLYCAVASDFSGLEPGAIWEDLKIGVGHLARWERVAVVTDLKWLEHTTRLLNFVIPGQMKSFAAAEATQARSWVTAR